MKKTSISLLTILALVATSTFVISQDAPPERQRPAGGGGPGGRGPGGPGGGRGFNFPLMAALDTDKDGKLSKEEIANASAALATLDADKNGELSREEMMGARGPRGGGAGGPAGADGAPRRPRTTTPPPAGGDGN